MRIKKYTARSMREALLQIREDLGEEAVILRTRKLPKGILSLGAPGEIEVTAAVEENATTKAMLTPLQLGKSAVYQRLGTRPEPGPQPGSSLTPGTTAGTEQSRDRGDQLQVQLLKEELLELKNMVRDLTKPPVSPVESGGFSGGWSALHHRLIEAEVKPEVATALVQDVRAKCRIEDAKVGDTFIATLTERFPVSGPLKLNANRPSLIAFVGPTGTGKTTTIAKLAAYYRLHKSARVSLITADTYRIAAIEQIRTFADIVGVRLQIMFNPDEADTVLENCQEDELVFIDSAGRSQKNAEHMGDLKGLLAALRPDETHLVVSATMKESDLESVVQTYSPFGVNRLLFTKLDETVHVGNILSTVLGCGLPVSYFTVGQNVPDDIELAEPQRLLRRMWEKSRA